MQETGPTVYSPYPRRPERLTICRYDYKGSTFSSVILRPCCWSGLGLEPSTSRTAVWRSTNWANQAAVSLPSLLGSSPWKFWQALVYLSKYLSNRCRRPDDGNRKRDISLEMSLWMYNTLWPDVALKLRTWERGVSHHDENLSTSCFCFDPFSVLLRYFRAKPR